MSDQFQLDDIDMTQQNKVIVKTTRADSLKCHFCCTHYSFSYRTSALISYYARLDERFKVLAFAFRYLARLLKMDKVELNTVAPHCFIVMTIFFLQSVKPAVLPCLHEALIESFQFDDECKNFDSDFIKKVHQYVRNRNLKIKVNCL